LVELRVLVAEDLAVVFVDLLVVEGGWIGWGGGRVVAVGEEGGAVWVVIFFAGGGRGVVGEADGF
jgi:hypothetical protein